MKLSSPFGCLSGPLQENNWIWSFGGAYREGGKNKSDGRRRGGLGICYESDEEKFSLMKLT